MSIVASGPLSLQIESLRVLLANVAAFQAWTGETDVAGAKSRIHLVDFPPPENDNGIYTVDENKALRPGASIDFWTPLRGYGEEPWSSSRIAESAYLDSSKLTLDLIDSIPDEDLRNPAEAKLAFLNNVGGVIDGLRNLAGSTSYLSSDDLTAGVGGLVIRKIEIYQLDRCDEAKLPTWGDHYRAQLLLTIGI